MPFIAALLISVAQEVNTTPERLQFTSHATFSRASSSADLTLLPAQWELEGLPKRARKEGSISSITSG
jgi:hypothetical protein